MATITDAQTTWPRDIKGRRKAVKADPVTGVLLCAACWNGKHEKKHDRCPEPECQCGCYKGRNKGLGKPHAPRKGCTENQSFPDVGAIQV